jgi:hypothetical protein
MNTIKQAICVIVNEKFIRPKPKESNPNTTENINPIKLVTSIASAIEHKNIKM